MGGESGGASGASTTETGGLGGELSSGGTESGGSSPSAGGSGGSPAAGGTGGLSFDSGFTQSEGRLPPRPTFCWVRRSNGSLTDSEWFSKRDTLQALISLWQGRSGLEIQWSEGCKLPGTGNPEEVRILLDDRTTTGETIPGCAAADRPGPWSLYPSEAPAFESCLWNMVIPANLESPRLALKAAGHALGYSHSRYRARIAPLVCPEPSEREPVSPYVSYYDAASVMHPAPFPESEFSEDTFEACTDEEGRPYRDRLLTSGDQLAIEMLYPAPGSPGLGASSWLWIEGVPTFREDQVTLVHDWLARGANPSWFSDYYWLLGDSQNQPIAILPDLIAYPSLPDSTSYTALHLSRDPFGATHSLGLSFRVDTGQHTALTIATAY
jgi:hypothetical protein